MSELHAMLRAVREFVDEHYPTLSPKDLVITFHEGRAFRTPVVPAGHDRERPAEPSAVPPQLNEMERDIVEAIGRDTLTGEQVAERSGYPFDSGLRSVLAGLRRRGVLGGDKGSTGYSVLNPSRLGV